MRGQTLNPWWQGLIVGPAVIVALIAFPIGSGVLPFLAGMTTAGAVAWLLIVLFNRNRIIVASNQRLSFFRASQVRATKATELLGELPQTTPLGPKNGTTWSVVIGVADNHTERVYVQWPFFNGIKKADAPGESAGIGS
jgi:hypothetical protein